MALSPENRALLAQKLPRWKDVDLDAAFYAVTDCVLEALMDAARAQGAAQAAEEVERLRAELEIIAGGSGGCGQLLTCPPVCNRKHRARTALEGAK